MKRILVSLILMAFFTSAMAEEPSKQPTESTTVTSQSPEKKVNTIDPKETTNIVDYCRTHTC